ncbi:MAG: lysine--tRNA ligase [Thermoplasmatota archaeon]
MHWADVAAQELLQQGDRHVLATAITPSGPIHVGNMREVLTTDAVARAIGDAGGQAELIYIGDTFDPLRKVYPFLPDSYGQHVGRPLSEIPCPCGSHDSYAQHYLSPFLQSLEELGITPRVYLAHELYRRGDYNQAIHTALDHADDIRRMLNSIASRNLPEGWMPFTVRCPACGRLDGAVTGYDWPRIRYHCGACGETGEVNALDGGVGKLPWRVDWPARWTMFDVTFEAFGKDHAAAGGSWDTGRAIVKKVYAHPAPMPLVYEFIHLKGRGAMHGSTGTAIAAEDMLQMTPPEVLRFLLMKSEPSRHIEFDAGFGLLDLVDEYDRYERAYYGQEDVELKEGERIYELSQPSGAAPGDMPVQVPYRHLVTVVQIADSYDGMLAILRRNGEIDELNEYEERKLRERWEKVCYWLEHFAPEAVQFEVQSSLPDVDLSSEQQRFLESLASMLEDIQWNAEAIHQAVYDAAEGHGLSASAAFRALYLILLGQKKGPRAGYFIHSLGREFMLRRLKKAA